MTFSDVIDKEVKCLNPSKDYKTHTNFIAYCYLKNYGEQ